MILIRLCTVFIKSLGSLQEIYQIHIYPFLLLVVTICQFNPCKKGIFRTNVQLGENKATHRELKFSYLFTNTAIIYHKITYRPHILTY